MAPRNPVKQQEIVARIAGQKAIPGIATRNANARTQTISRVTSKNASTETLLSLQMYIAAKIHIRISVAAYNALASLSGKLAFLFISPA